MKRNSRLRGPVTWDKQHSGGLHEWPGRQAKATLCAGIRAETGHPRVPPQQMKHGGCQLWCFLPWLPGLRATGSWGVGAQSGWVRFCGRPRLLWPGTPTDTTDELLCLSASGEDGNRFLSKTFWGGRGGPQTQTTWKCTLLPERCRVTMMDSLWRQTSMAQATA